MHNYRKMSSEEKEKETVTCHKFVDKYEVEQELESVLQDWSLADNDDSLPRMEDVHDWRARYEAELDRNIFERFKSDPGCLMKVHDMVELEREMLEGQKCFLDYFNKNSAFVDKHRIKVSNLERSIQTLESNLKAKQRAKERMERKLMATPAQPPPPSRRFSPSPKKKKNKGMGRGILARMDGSSSDDDDSDKERLPVAVAAPPLETSAIKATTIATSLDKIDMSIGNQEKQLPEIPPKQGAPGASTSESSHVPASTSSDTKTSDSDKTNKETSTDYDSSSSGSRAKNQQLHQQSNVRHLKQTSNDAASSSAITTNSKYSSSLNAIGQLIAMNVANKDYRRFPRPRQPYNNEENNNSDEITIGGSVVKQQDSNARALSSMGFFDDYGQ